MAKKTRKSTRKSRRRTRRRIPRSRRGGGDSYPLIPNNTAIEVSTAGDNSDNLMGMKVK
uniref:Uncharacterized protein n=1 Tax=viral metagenome TaxID=1070528 RepID=A0A6C0F4A1_9ZZZZ